eukprot:1308651-Rhodomonas_salina.1
MMIIIIIIVIRVRGRESSFSVRLGGPPILPPLSSVRPVTARPAGLRDGHSLSLSLSCSLPPSPSLPVLPVPLQGSRALACSVDRSRTQARSRRAGLTAHCSLLTAHCSLLTAPPVLTAHARLTLRRNWKLHARLRVGGSEPEGPRRRLPTRSLRISPTTVASGDSGSGFTVPGQGLIPSVGVRLRSVDCSLT